MGEAHQPSFYLSIYFPTSLYLPTPSSLLSLPPIPFNAFLPYLMFRVVVT